MKVKVIRPFIDKNDAKTYYIGDVVDGFSEDRVKELKEKGVIEVLKGTSVKEAPEKTKEAPEKQDEKQALKQK